jgi:hypothetical protein
LKVERAFPLLHDLFVDLGAVFYDGIKVDHDEEHPDDDETPEERYVFCSFSRYALTPA